MTLENQLLDAVIQDQKERIVLGLSPFGDIFFKEDNGCGQMLFSVCQIVPPTRPRDNPAKKGEFMFELRVVALTEKEFKGFLNSGIGRLFGLTGSRQFQELYDDIVLRRGLRAALKKRLGKLGSNEVYAYCHDDDYNSTNPFATRLNKQVYLEEVLAFAKQFPRQYYTDIYQLAGAGESGPFVLKRYLGYGFEIPDPLFECTNLKSLAIYKQSVKALLPEKLIRFKNLNSLALDNVGGLSKEILESIHKLPYLVELSLTNTDKYAGRTVFSEIPPRLNQLHSLRAFSFAGHTLSNWAEIGKLKNLRKLDLSNCGLTSISSDIAGLEHLEELNLSNNKIKCLPEGLKELKNLKVLRLNGNCLTEVPSWIEHLKNLWLLDLTQSELTSLPKEIASLPRISELHLKKNPFQTLPKNLLALPKKTVKIEMRNEALYDAKAKAKLAKYPKGNVKFEKDFNFKLMVINQLMYRDKVLFPKFDIWDFVKTYTKRHIDIEVEGYEPIAESIAYFKNLEIPMDLLIDIKELKPDGGDEIYRQIIPFWDGEDDQFEVRSVEDVTYIPNLKATNNMNFPKELIKELRAMKIKVANY